MRVLLDGNIYNKLENDTILVKRIAELIKSGELIVICNQVVEKELVESPYGVIPNWFPVKTITEPGAFIGYATIAPDSANPSDERYAKIMPNISTYTEHRGSSNKKKDAILADTALRLCEYVVSEDKRFLRRLALSPIDFNCKGLAYAEFKEMLENRIA